MGKISIFALIFCALYIIIVKNIFLALRNEAEKYINLNRHDRMSAAGGVGTLGYVHVGDFRDTIIVPPLANITVKFDCCNTVLTCKKYEKLKKYLTNPFLLLLLVHNLRCDCIKLEP